jgi:type II secretory pathway predicted ATPase ExeA
MRREADSRLLRHFGVDKMGYFFSKTSDSFCQDIEDAFLNKQMTAIIGPVGAGKSELFDAAVGRQHGIIEIVYVTNLYKEKVNIASIINAIIYGISDESPRRDLEARTIQLRRLVKEKIENEKKTVVVVIEEAHRLHPDLFRSLKELREMTYSSKGNLFSIVLIGHSKLLSNIKSRREAYWRCNMIELNEANGWMTEKERVAYIKTVFKHAITPEAAKTIATVCKVPLEIVDYVEKKMIEARKVGKKVLDSEVVKPTNKELMEAYDLSLKNVADAAGLGKSTIHDIVNNPEHKFSGKVSDAIQKLISDKKKDERKVA